MKPDLGDRIEVVKNYGDIPHGTCYASSLNHVFMDVLRKRSEAAARSRFDLALKLARYRSR